MERLKNLIPEFQEKAGVLLEKCRNSGISMVPNSTLRSPFVQARLWRQSRTKQTIEQAIVQLQNDGAPFLASVLESVGPQAGPEVTKVLPGNSWHQWGEALDCYWEVGGAAEWSDRRLIEGKNGYKVYADHALDVGLEPGFYWKSFKDSPHVQFRKTSNPRAANITWPEIDRVMRQRFGNAPDGGSVSFSLLNKNEFAAPSIEAPSVSYAAPEGWNVYQTKSSPAVLFRSKMSICADGAPKAYHQTDALALDYLANAGRPGNWWGIVTENGTPVVQDAADPAPGFYVSTTALINSSSPLDKPRGYIDAATIPYIVLPQKRFKSFHTEKSLSLGDFGLAYNRKNRKFAYAICGESGPASQVGEGSIRLAELLEINSNAKNGGMATKDVIYMAFPGTGNGRGRTLADINSLGETLFEQWGGLPRLEGLTLE